MSLNSTDKIVAVLAVGLLVFNLLPRDDTGPDPTPPPVPIVEQFGLVQLSADTMSAHPEAAADMADCYNVMADGIAADGTASETYWRTTEQVAPFMLTMLRTRGLLQLMSADYVAGYDDRFAEHFEPTGEGVDIDTMIRSQLVEWFAEAAYGMQQVAE